MKKFKKVPGRKLRKSRKKKSLLAHYRRKFIGQFKFLTFPLLAIHFAIFIGTLGYMIISDIHTGKPHFMDAFFMAITTISAVGYGETSPGSDTSLGRIFTAFLSLSGIGIYATYITVIITTILEGDIIELYKIITMLKNIQNLKDHVIICGYNKTSAWLANTLRERGLDFVVIDDREIEIEYMRKHNIKYFITEDPIEIPTLESAGIKKARVLIANLEDDARNMALIATARLIVPSKDELAIYTFASTDGTAEKMEKLGANKALILNKILATRLASHIFHTGARYITNLLSRVAFGEVSDIDIIEYKIASFSSLVGKKLKDVNLREKYNLTIIAIRKKDGRVDMDLIPETQIEEGDTLIIFGDTRNMRNLEKILKEAII